MIRSTLPINLSETVSNEPPQDYRDHPARVLPEVSAPVGAPNVLLILVDDMGFGASSAYGGPCRMPAAERLADEGVRFSRFHTTSMCSPTRAALLTGRNHHSVEMGSIPDMATTTRGYTGIRPGETATLARVLQCNGYATGAFGKMHQTPPWETSEAGPFDRWPTNEGFDRFYGFLGAETNQFSPNLFDGLSPVAPHTGRDDYHLSEDLVDKTFDWIRSVKSLAPEKPWFTYLSFGACHAPFQVPASWRDRYRGEFSLGWDEQRKKTFERQKQLGLVPADASLPELPVEVPKWDDLTANQRLAAERLMEAYAAYAEHMDAQVNRLLDALESEGQLDNTLVLYILGDNGASAEGGIDGTLNENTRINGFTDSADRIVEQLDLIGGEHSYVHYPSGWALTMNTPYQWAKSVASHYGGTRNGMLVRWPERVAKSGGVLHQWHHCIDVAPTILEAAGIPEPSKVDGFDQAPIEGVSFLYALEQATADDRHKTQYFEMYGNRGIYHNGWTAVTRHRSIFEMKTAKLPAFNSDVWELYDTSSDWTQAKDVGNLYPEKLAELKQLFLDEGLQHNVFPLDDRFVERLNPTLAGRKDIMAGRPIIKLYPGTRGLREDTAPNVKNTSFMIAAEVSTTEAAQDGVVVAQGGRFSGWSFYVKNGVLSYVHNLAGLAMYEVRSSTPLPHGKHTLKMWFQYDGGGVGQGGTVVLYIDDAEVGRGRVEQTIPFLFSLDETFDVGIDRGTPVTDDYDYAPMNAFQGLLDHVTVTIGDDAVHVGDEERAAAIAVSH